jgi:uroporphyrinogen-III synthase
MPPNKIAILSTRPLGKGLAEEAAAMDIIIEALSFIETEPLRDPVLDKRIRELSRESLTAVFTSMNAVDAVTDCLRAQKEETWPPWKIYCIGTATRQRVEEYFGEDSIAGTASSAGELADRIIRDANADPAASAGPDAGAGPDAVAGIRALTFFCGDQRRDELPERLRQAGIGVRELVVYRTRQTPHQLEKGYDGIVFFSPSAVHSFFSLNKAPAATVLFAIGRTTAEAIRQYSANPTICGVSPEKDALIRLAMDHFRGRIEKQ